MVAKMRLCEIGDGRSIHILRTVKWMKDRGHDVLFISYEDVNRTLARDIGGGLDGVDVRVVGDSHKYLLFPFRDRKIQKIISDWNPDVTHAHFVTKYGFHLPKDPTRRTAISAWGADILDIGDIAGTVSSGLPFGNRAIKYYTKKALERADIIYAVSQDIRCHIIDDFMIDKRKIVVNPIGINTDVFDPSNYTRSEGDTIRVMSNRAIDTGYDTRTMILAFHLAQKEYPDMHLYLTGAGRDVESVKVFVNELGIKDKVSFLGFRPNMVQCLANSDIFMSTTLLDGTPISVLEAMAMEKCVVATGVGGIPEWITNGDTGMLAPAKDAIQLSIALVMLARSPELRIRMGKAARKAVFDKGGDYKINMAAMERGYQMLSGVM
jgi:L-malate glycosyltransferase